MKDLAAVFNGLVKWSYSPVNRKEDNTNSKRRIFLKQYKST